MSLFPSMVRSRAFVCVAVGLFAGGCAEPLTAPAVRPAAPSGRSAVVLSTAFNGRIRIGVVPTASTITIGSDAPWTLRNKTTGAILIGNGLGNAAVTLASGSISHANWRLQVECTSSTAERDARLALAASQGYPTYTAFNTTANCWQVMIGEYPPTMTFSQRVAEKAVIVAKGEAPANAFWQNVTITEGVTSYSVSYGSDPAISTPDPLVLDAAGSPVRINGVPYRGVAEVVRNSGGSLAGVNELPIEEYLYGVVPRELPPNPWGQPEAQKAQAIAARTYALSGLGKRGRDGYDLLATTSDQVYGGFSAEQPVSTAAVDATRGIVAEKNGNLISALYSSTTGGWTANNEEVYNSAPVDYLRSVPDEQRGDAVEHVPSLDVFRNAANARALRAASNGAFDADWSSYHRWTFEWTPAEISAVLSASYGQPVGKVEAINVIERGPSGRVMLIEFVTEKGTFQQTKDAIRSTLKYINNAGTQTSLPSTLFFMEPVIDPRTKEVDGFRVYGGGFGHGVGMGQTGAAGMADKGASYEEILKHYYQGIDLTTAY